MTLNGRIDAPVRSGRSPMPRAAALFAEEAPSLFEHDPDTNRLSLRAGMPEPWLRLERRARAEREHSWLYCHDCSDRHFETKKEVLWPYNVP